MAIEATCGIPDAYIAIITARGLSACYLALTARIDAVRLTILKVEASLPYRVGASYRFTPLTDWGFAWR